MKITEIKSSESDDESVDVISDSESNESEGESDSSDSESSNQFEHFVAGEIFSITSGIQELLDKKDQEIEKLRTKLQYKAKENSELKLQVKYLKEDAKAEKGTTPQLGSTLSRLNSAGIVKKVAITAGFALAGLATIAALGFLGTIIAPFALPLLGAGLLIAAIGMGVSKIIEHKSKTRDALTVKTTLENPKAATCNVSVGIS